MEPAWKPGTDTGVTAAVAAPRLLVTPLFHILGPLEIRLGDAEVLGLRGERPRRLLARLLLDPGRVVSADSLIDAVWDGDPPASAAVTLRSHVAMVRRALIAGGIDGSVVTRPPGYLLLVTPDQVDAPLFERDVTDGKAALERGDAGPAARTLRKALGRWRGRLLQDLGPPRFAEAAAARLEKLRLTALEARIDADLVLGRHRDLVGELEALVDAHLFRKPIWVSEYGFSPRLVLPRIRDTNWSVQPGSGVRAVSGGAAAARPRVSATPVRAARGNIAIP